jgi:hypothetical protein
VLGGGLLWCAIFHGISAALCTREELCRGCCATDLVLRSDLLTFCVQESGFLKSFSKLAGAGHPRSNDLLIQFVFPGLQAITKFCKS